MPVKNKISIHVPKGVTRSAWVSHRRAWKSHADKLGGEGSPAEEQPKEKPAKQRRTAADRAGAPRPPDLWPAGDGLLMPPGRTVKKQEKGARVGQSDPEKAARKIADFKHLKALDIVAFNGQSERFFIQWLTDRLKIEEFGAVSVAWCISNAAYKLDISPETVKRYLVKLTAEEAPFRVSDGMIFLNENGGSNE